MDADENKTAEPLDIRTLKTDERKESEGVWQPAGGTCELLIARFGNPRCTTLFTQLTKPNRRPIDQGTMPPKKQIEILAKVMAETVLLDWRDMTEGGRPVEYSKAEAYRLLVTYRELREMVEEYAKDNEAYREEQIEEAAGN